MITIQEMQDVELEIMQKIHLYCEKHNIRYVMTYGTLLGAVRHKGFIPWDNDMDIAMRRADYNRFLELTKTEPIGEHLYVEHYTTDSRYHYMCIRVCDDRTVVNVPYIREQPVRLGLWVDVFPMDGVIANPVRRAFQTLALKFYWVLFRADVYGLKDVRSPVHRMIKRIGIFLFPNKNNRNNYRIDKISINAHEELCEYVDFLFEQAKGSGMLISEVEDPVLMEFGQYSFYAPKHYDRYLRAYYGEYMQLPPPEKRVTHGIDVQWKQ